MQLFCIILDQRYCALGICLEGLLYDKEFELRGCGHSEFIVVRQEDINVILVSFLILSTDNDDSVCLLLIVFMPYANKR